MSNIDSVVGSFSDTLPNGMTLEGCWSIKIKDVKDPFAFCNKFAGMIWGGTLPLALNALAENNLVITPLIEQASFANLQVESISTTVKAARGGQLAKLQKVRQSGKSRKVTVTYLNNKSELQTFTANLPKIKNKRGKTLTLRAQTNGDQASLVTNIQIPDSDNDNSSSSEPIAMPDGVPQITSEDEMRSFVESLDGINKLAGKVGGKRFQVALPKDFVALPVGKVSTRLR